MVGLRGADHLGVRSHWDSGSAAAAALIYLLTPELMRDQELATVQERQIGRGGERGRRGRAEKCSYSSERGAHGRGSKGCGRWWASPPGGGGERAGGAPGWARSALVKPLTFNSHLSS